MSVAYKEYKVVRVSQTGIGILILGASAMPINKVETLLNQEALNGWSMVFQVVEVSRYMLFWKRQSVIVTLGR